MKVADFKEFVRLVALAELDIGTAQLGFRGGPRPLVWYQGQHIGAVTLANESIAIEGLASKDESFAVEATRLSEILRILPDEADLRAKLAAPDFLLLTKGTRLALRVTRGSRPPQMDRGGADLALALSDSSLDLLSRALGLLDEITGKKVLKPVLAGTRISVTANAMRLEATDGIRAAILEIPVEGTDGIYGVVPVADLRVALPIFTGTSLHVERYGNRIDLTGGRTRVRLSLYADEGFPDLQLAFPKQYAQTIELSTRAITMAAKAAAVLDATARVVLTARRNRIVLSVKSQELGAFQTVGGEGVLDFEVTFDAGHLGAIEPLGSTIKLHLNDAASPVMIEGEQPNWRCWLAPIYSPTA